MNSDYDGEDGPKAPGVTARKVRGGHLGYKCADAGDVGFVRDKRRGRASRGQSAPAVVGPYNGSGNLMIG